MKECTKCGVQKGAADFYSDSQKKDGLSSSCKECKKVQNNLYAKSNKERKAKYDKMNRARNSVEIKKRKKEYSDSHKEEKKAYDKRYNADPLNKVKRYQGSAAYRASKRSQTPELTDEEKLQIIEIYKEAMALRKTTGDNYHVDHIIPLSKGGLHHPLNLQIITASDNLSKGNKCDISEVSNELLDLHDKHYGCNFLEYSTISSKGTSLK